MKSYKYRRPSAIAAKFKAYKDAKGEWKWSFLADNNEKVANSGEGCKEKDDCIDGINVLKREAPTAAPEQP